MLSTWDLVADDGSVTSVRVPGTVTQAFAEDLDARTWVFRTEIAVVPPSPVELVLDGVATSYEVVLDGTVIATGRSMFTRHRLDVDALVHKGSVLEIRCLPLATALPEGKPPRARWRSKLVDDNSLRLIRTMLLGRCPGFAPGPPVVGPWAPVTLRTRVEPLGLRTALDGTTGVLMSTSTKELTCCGITGIGEVRIPDVDLWWPHTHGTPTLHDVTVDGSVVARVGFRSVVNAAPDSLDLVVNGVPVWVRGAVWTPPGLLAGIPEEPFTTVLAARDAGMNLLRVPGTATYESETFFAACDQLGVLVWHDLALANLDVPHELLGLPSELDDLLDTAAGHPSLAVVCGGSEVAQQVAMLGLDPKLWESGFLRAAPEVIGDQAVWIGNSPVGGALPFRVGTGVAHWFGVGGYLRPLSDVRVSDVRFASECLAFSIPSAVGDFVPRDNGADWDFADVTNHYATSLGRPPEAVVGEVMAHVFGDWRRAASRNRGGVILWLRDLQAGAGWGILDWAGAPKQPWWQLSRALAARAVWLTDEGLDGMAVHLANDKPSPWSGELRLSLYRADDVMIEQVVVPVDVPPHGSWTSDVEGVLGRFVDVSYAFRFGAATVATVVAAFDTEKAFAFPVGRPSTVHDRDVLTVEQAGEMVRLTSTRLLDGVRVEGASSDSWFCLEPGRTKTVWTPVDNAAVAALNLA